MTTDRPAAAGTCSCNPAFAGMSHRGLPVLLERFMVWRVERIDPKANPAAQAVLKAFESARRAGRPSVECYRAGVEAWRREHPDQSPEYSAKRAVAVILDSHTMIRIED